MGAAADPEAGGTMACMAHAGAAAACPIEPTQTPVTARAYRAAMQMRTEPGIEPSAEPSVELDAPQQDRLVQALAAALAREHGGPVQHIQTHISHVLLAGAQAIKLKKVLRNAFLDQSSLARRRHACEEELRLNRRLAPELYRAALPVTGHIEAPRVGGDGPVLDWLVLMRAFDQQGLWDRLAARGALASAHVDALAALLVRFQAAAAVAPSSGRFGQPATLCAAVRDNLVELQSLWPAPADPRLAALAAWTPHTGAGLQPLMAERLAQGFVREGHGDLHLGNVAQIDGHTTVFDGIEFNDDFRWLDVVGEIAFIVMDLQAHGLPALANRLLDAWLAHSGDYAGLPLLDYHLVYRALVRAKVSLLRAAQGGSGAAAAQDPQVGQAVQTGHIGQTPSAPDYLALALACTQRARPVLMVTHGLSGSGKSTLTQGLLEAAGAVRIRADVQRKRLAGLTPLQASGSTLDAGLYSPAMNAATAERLLQLAQPVLAAGHHVILDATFLRRSQRDAARGLAAALGVPFVLLDFHVDEALLRQRLRQRAANGGDASEANEAVLDAQLRRAEPLDAAEAAAAWPVAQQPDWGPLVGWLRGEGEGTGRAGN